MTTANMQNYTDRDINDLRQMIRALTIHGWTVEKRSFYDEEGVEGWVWTSGVGVEYGEIGAWDDTPPWPDGARDAITKLEER